MAKKQKKEAEEKEPQFYRSAIGDETINYRVYYMSKTEKVLSFLLAFAVGGAVGYLFYGGLGKDSYGNPTLLTHIINGVVVLLCGVVSGKMFLPIRQEQILKNRQGKLKTQFRDMLEALSTSLGAGNNMPDSFVAANEDLKNQYEEDAFILQELQVIINGMNSSITPEELLRDFGRRSGCEDIEDFAGVFDISLRRSGDIRETVQNTCRILTDKMQIAEDIETTISSSKNEQYIMLVMPIALVGLIKVSSPEFAANFATFSGVVATTIGVILFVISYFIGKKLLDIKV